MRCYWLETSVIEVAVTLTAALSSSLCSNHQLQPRGDFVRLRSLRRPVVFRGQQLPSHLCVYFLTWNKEHAALRWTQSLNMELVSAPLFAVSLWAPSFQLSKLHASSAEWLSYHLLLFSAGNCLHVDFRIALSQRSFPLRCSGRENDPSLTWSPARVPAIVCPPSVAHVNYMFGSGDLF